MAALPSLSFTAMGRSEYFEIKKTEGEAEQPQIIIDAEALYDLLLRAEMMMNKVDRVRYANRAIEQILDVIKQPHQVALPMQLEMYTIYTSTLVDSVIQIVFNNGINFHIIQL